MFAADLAHAKRPAILVGGGAHKARAAIEQFAHTHSIPCFRTWNALDVVTDDSPVYGGTVGTYGGPGRNFGIQNCDLLLSLGCRMSGRITGGMPETFARGAKKYIVDIDPVALEPELQQVKGDVNVRADAGGFIEGLPTIAADFGDWLARCRQWLLKYDPVRDEHMAGAFHHYGFMRLLSNALPDSAIVVSDTGGNQIMMGHCFQSKKGQRIFSSNGNTPMGFALCGAMGAWFAEPLRPVICIIGDGGFNLNIQELQTIVNYGIAIKVFIIDNHVLGNTKAWQRVNGRAEVACGPDGYKPPDFEKVVKAYGIDYGRIKRWRDFEPEMEFMLSSRRPAICDVVHHDFCQYEPRISRWDVGIEDAYPFLPRDEFRANMLIEPLPGWENVK